MDTIIIFFAKHLYLFIVVGAFLTSAISGPQKRKKLIILVLIALPISYGLGEAAGLLIQNPRPFVAEGVAPLIPHASNNGFPSTHTLMSMAIAGAVFTYNKKIGSVLAIMALLVGLGRVLAGVHSPIDIFGGVIIAVIAVYTSMQILRSLSPTVGKYIN